MASRSKFVGKRVRLVGLSNAALCGAEGLASALDAASGRLCVRLSAPQAAVAAHPAGVKARRGASCRCGVVTVQTPSRPARRQPPRAC